MTTRAYVPNVDGEGSIGTTDKKWGAMYVASPDSTASDNRVASTAWVQSIVADALADALAKQKAAYEQAISTAVSAAQAKAKLDAHPVGSYYWSNDKTSPATLFGGTWEALPAGYTLIAQGSGSDDFGSFTYTAGQKYGERKHQLTTDELPKFTPSTSEPIWNDGSGTELGHTVSWRGHGTLNILSQFSSIGKDTPHNNLPPSVCAYAWIRTA